METVSTHSFVHSLCLQIMYTGQRHLLARAEQTRWSSAVIVSACSNADFFGRLRQRFGRSEFHLFGLNRFGVRQNKCAFVSITVVSLV